MLNSQAPFVDPASSPVEASASSLPQQYETRQLVFPPQDHGYRPTGLNDAGHVIGNIIHPVRFPGDHWKATGLYLPPHHFRNQTLPSAEMACPFMAINEEGLVVGTQGSNTDELGAWASHLGAFGRQYWPEHLSHAQDVNALGEVVGKTLLAADPVLVARAFFVRPGAEPRYFVPPEGGLTDAIALNDASTILFNVTALSTRSPLRRAWLWQEEEFVVLRVPPRCASVGIALNERDDVVGMVETEFGLRRPVIWINGEPQDLDTTEAQDFRPTCLNNDRLIGGSALNAFAQRAACIWSPQEGLRFLDQLQSPPNSQPLKDVVAINQANQILATQVVENQPLGFLLDPSD